MRLMNKRQLFHELTNFLNDWKTFFDLSQNALNPNKEQNQEEEDVFLALKAKLAQKQAILTPSLPIEMNFGEESIKVLAQVVSLKEMKNMSPGAIKKFESNWHELYLKLNSLYGVLSSSIPHKQTSENNFVSFMKRLFQLILILGIILVGFFFINKYYGSSSEYLSQPKGGEDAVIIVEEGLV